MNDVFAEHRNSLIILTCWHGSIAAGTPSALRRYLLCCHHVPIIPALHMFWYSLRNCIAPWWLGAESSFRNIKLASGHGEAISATAGNSSMMMPTLSAVGVGAEWPTKWDRAVEIFWGLVLSEEPADPGAVLQPLSRTPPGPGWGDSGRGRDPRRWTDAHWPMFSKHMY